MSEKAEEEATKEPAPTKESDANRVTEEEAEQTSGSSQEPEGSEQD